MILWTLIFSNVRLRQFFKEGFPMRWIARRDSVGSPDLTTVDFHQKTKFYSTKPTNLEVPRHELFRNADCWLRISGIMQDNIRPLMQLEKIWGEKIRYNFHTKISSTRNKKRRVLRNFWSFVCFWLAEVDNFSLEHLVY